MVASVEKGFYCINLKLDRDKGKEIHAESCESRFPVDGSGDSVV